MTRVVRTFGEHVPALMVVFEYEAEQPELICSSGVESLQQIVRWLERSHPEWLERVVVPAIELVEGMGIEEE